MARVLRTITNRRGIARFWNHLRSAIGSLRAASFWNSSTTADTNGRNYGYPKVGGKQTINIGKRRCTGLSAMAHGTNSPWRAFGPSMGNSRCAISAISRPMRLPAGRALACRPKPNGKWPAKMCQSKAIGLISYWPPAAAVHPTFNSIAATQPAQMFGAVWQWTASPYTAYPGYRAAEGALRRVQRQVHVQSVRAARRFVRHAVEPHPPHVSQLFSAGNPLAIRRHPPGKIKTHLLPA